LLKLSLISYETCLMLTQRGSRVKEKNTGVNAMQIFPVFCHAKIGASSGSCCYLIKYAQQVIKKRRKNRVIKVERRLIIGTKSKMEQPLFESEDSSIKKQLSFREVFTALEIIFWWFFMFLRTRVRVEKFMWISA